MFNQDSGMRSTARKVLLFYSDGKSSDPKDEEHIPLAAKLIEVNIVINNINNNNFISTRICLTAKD